MAIAYSGEAAVKALTGGSNNVWSTGRILTVGAGTLLAMYSVKLAYEYLFEEDEDDRSEEEDEEQNGSQGTKFDRAGVEKDIDDDAESQSTGVTVEMRERSVSGQFESREFVPSASHGDAGTEKRRQTLFVIAFLGSVDDLTLFVPMLVGKTFDLAQLMLGAFVAVSLIVGICIFLGQCKPIANCLSSIPLAAIVLVFASCLLVKGCLFMD
eukprot:TRINITY_DN59466_c0_g1_i1.p1 TRINITY_DN59466_c0_g1~~TRINITY_DN59466_c0_g1_i1.p1  ORF type:complete len:236 (-),score=55.52 TRINITY_DN59466_c0_g1_i1:23-655(-)